MSNGQATIEEYFLDIGNKRLGMTKLKHYLKVYDKYLEKFKGKKPNVLEI